MRAQITEWEAADFFQRIHRVGDTDKYVNLEWQQDLWAYGDEGLCQNGISAALCPASTCSALWQTLVKSGPNCADILRVYVWQFSEPVLLPLWHEWHAVTQAYLAKQVLSNIYIW